MCVALSLWLALGAQLQACSVPVFRYALERWPADTYGIVVFHRGKLTAGDQAVVDWLKKAGQREEGYDRFVVKAVDLAGKPEEHFLKIWKEQKKAELPWVVVLYPPRARVPVPAWTGRLSAPAARNIADSPARREVAKRILAGETAVWLFLEHGDKKKDDAAARLLKAELKKAEKLLKLPADMDPDAADEADEGAKDEAGVTVEVVGDDPNDDGDFGPKIRVAFSVLRLSRSDPKERFFVHMLLNSEEGLWKLAEPMAFPIFGRGRAFDAHVGAGINSENIIETCAFLCGPCACQIKAMAPGRDMLMATNWDAALMGEEAKEPELPPLVGLPDPATAAKSTAGAQTPEPGAKTQGTDDDQHAAAAIEPAPAHSRRALRPNPLATESIDAVAEAESEAADPEDVALDDDDELEPTPSPLVRNLAIAVGAALLGLTIAAVVLTRRNRYPRS